VEVLAVDIGSKLIPVVSAVVGFFVQHKVAAEALAVVIGGVMVVAIASYVAKLAWGAAETVGKLALMVAGWMGIGPAADAAAAETEIAGGVMDAAFGPVGLAIGGVERRAEAGVRVDRQQRGASADGRGARVRGGLVGRVVGGRLDRVVRRRS